MALPIQKRPRHTEPIPVQGEDITRIRREEEIKRRRGCKKKSKCKCKSQWN
jgi:hypothetical protein